MNDVLATELLAAYSALRSGIASAINIGGTRAGGIPDDADLIAKCAYLREESDGRKHALLAVGEERRAEWVRAERAEGAVRELGRRIQEIVAWRDRSKTESGWAVREEFTLNKCVAILSLPAPPDYEIPQPQHAAPTPLWVVGKVTNYRSPTDVAWEFQGVYATEAEAAARCEDCNWWIGPVTIGEHVPTEWTPHPGCYYPAAGREQQVATPTPLDREAEMPAAIDPGICPDCGQRPLRICKCPLSDSRCSNSHEWYVCPVHGTVIRGRADHSRDTFQCRCHMAI